ncbi:MAG: Gfo/Idh/MocA family oxidoreductase [Pseudomonadota bacterium]
MAVKAGIVGYGLAGRVFHAPLLPAAGIDLHGVASSKPEVVTADHPEAVVYGTPEEMFADAAIDLVILASPTPTHTPLAIKALEAGKHVIVDKPFAATVADADAMIEAAEKAGKILTCFQNRRWDGDFLTLRKLMDEGALGDVQFFQSHFEFFKGEAQDRWQEKAAPGVGVQFDLGAHQVDQALVLFGRPAWVQGEAIIQRKQGEVADRFALTMGYEGGLRVQIYCSYVSPDFRMKYVVQGDQGAYRKYHMDIQEPQLRERMTPLDAGFGVEPKERFGTLTRVKNGKVINEIYPTEPGTQHEIYVRLRKAIEEGGEPPVLPAEARMTIEVIEAGVRSGEMGQRVVL